MEPIMKQLLLVTIVMFILCTPGFSIELYISPDGSDNNPGTKDKPMATLQAARDAIRELKKDYTIGIQEWQEAMQGASRTTSIVWLREGVYELTGTFELTQQDNAVIYRAFEGEDVRVIGGRKIDPSTAKSITDPAIRKRIISADARDKIQQIDLKKLGITNYGEMSPRGYGRPKVNSGMELFINGKALHLARWPNDEYVSIVKVIDTGTQPGDRRTPIVHEPDDKGGRFVYDHDRPSLWAQADDIWIHGVFGTAWADDTLKIDTIDTDKKEISLVQAHCYGITARHGAGRYHALNLLEEIDRPGEYFLDRKTGVIYFYPFGSLAGAEIIVSTLDEPLITMAAASYVTIRDITFESSRGVGILIEGGKKNLIAGCTIRNIGVVAVDLGKGWAKDNPGTNHGVVGCDIYNIGAGGVLLGGGDRKTLTPAGNYVINCEIHHTNRLDKTYRPCINMQGVGNRMAHNYMHDATRSAIMFYGNDHIIEYNEIHDVMLDSDDGGAIYTGSDITSYGGIIRHNFFYRCRGPENHYSQAIYIDDYHGGTEVYGNVFYDLRSGVFVSGRDSKVFNNIFVDCDSPIVVQLRRPRTQRLKRFPIKQPPWSTKYPNLAIAEENYWGEFMDIEVRDNIYFGKIVKVDYYPGYSSGETELVVVDRVNRQFMTIERNLMLKKNPFVKSSKLNFQLKDDSEVYKKIPDFEKIPFEKIGLYKDRYRRNLPNAKAFGIHRV